MNPGLQYVLDQATKAAAHRLRQAETFARLNMKQPLFQKRMGKGADAVLVRFEWPGVLTVLDPETGAVLAASEAGRPAVSRPGFVAPMLTLSSNDPGRQSIGGR